jgi:hypothetical protein
MEPNPALRRRVMAVRRDLENILGAMASVRRVGALYDITDRDLMDTPAEPKPKRKEAPVPAAPEVDGE